jgi:hypothetical protein
MHARPRKVSVGNEHLTAELRQVDPKIDGQQALAHATTSTTNGDYMTHSLVLVAESFVLLIFFEVDVAHGGVSRD